MGRMKDIMIGYEAEWYDHDCHKGPEDSCGICDRYSCFDEYANARYEQEYGAKAQGAIMVANWNDSDDDQDDEDGILNSDDQCEDCGDTDCNQDRTYCAGCEYEHCDNYNCNETSVAKNWSDLDEQEPAGIPQWNDIDKDMKVNTWNNIAGTPTPVPSNQSASNPFDIDADTQPGAKAPLPTLTNNVCLNSLPTTVVKCEPSNQQVVTCKKCGVIAKPMPLFNEFIYVVPSTLCTNKKK